MSCIEVAEIVLPSSPVASIEFVVPDGSFPVQISTVDSVEVIATGSTGSVEVVFPIPETSTVIVLPAPGPKGDKGDPGNDGQPGADGQPGQDGAGLTAVHVTAAQYAALTVEQQNDPSKWWVIPKA